MKNAKKLILKHNAWLSWLDDHILLLLTGFLLAFIPLYPKLPIIDLLPGYIVRLRLEDFFILFTSLVWGVQVLRKKAALSTPLTWMIFAYIVVGLASSLSAVYYTYTVPEEYVHLLKLALHYVRRIEYFSLFFIAFSAIRERAQLKILLGIFCLSALLVSLYGVGQKYLYWPVYSTMNREFSKGLQLYLTEHARVQSTFGGHYDYAAYLVMVLPVILALAFAIRKPLLKIGMWATFIVSLWGLMMTSSRSSFLAYIAAIVIVILGMAIRRGWLWGITRMFIVMSLTAVFLTLFGDLLDRFGQIFKDNSAYVAIQKTVNDAKTVAQAPIVQKPKNAISVDDVAKAAAAAAVIDKTDTLPTPVELPPDVYENIPDKVVRKTAKGEEITVEVPRVFSDNAKQLGLSAAIRLDTLWPFAIRGFLRNPLLGSGYSTLTKYTIEEFTEAESTDNDFLRTLGETGALGFMTFYGTMVLAIAYLWRRYQKTSDGMTYMLALLATAYTVGLMINAVYIDVFVSSKVIQTYWMVIGISLAYAVLTPNRVTPKAKPVMMIQNGKRKKAKA